MSDQLLENSWNVPLERYRVWGRTGVGRERALKYLQMEDIGCTISFPPLLNNRSPEASHKGSLSLNLTFKK